MSFLKFTILSNVYAIIVTLCITYAWLFTADDPEAALAYLWMLFAGLIIVLLLHTLAKYYVPRYESADLRLRSPQAQLAPTAAASMVVGWSGYRSDLTSIEAWALILLGFLYSFWCVILASETSADRNTKDPWALTFSHVIVPILLGIAIAGSAETPEETKRRMCDTASQTNTLYQCGMRNTLLRSDDPIRIASGALRGGKRPSDPDQSSPF